MFLKNLIIFALTFNIVKSQYLEVARIDSTMTADRQRCIDHESTIATLLSNLSTTITNVTATLRAEFLSRDLCTALDNLKSLLELQMTINDWLPYVNISTCGDINYKITMVDFDRQKLLRVRAEASSNITALYARYAQVAVLSARIITTSYYTSVTSIMSQTIGIITEFSRYSGITIGQSLVNCIVNSNLLNAFKRTFCTCLATAAINRYNSTLERNVDFIESALLRNQNNIKNSTTSALNSCKEAYSSVTTGASAGAIASSLLNLKSTLRTLETASNYPTIRWTNVANCNDLMIRVRFIHFKQNQYVNIYIDNNRNHSWLTHYQITVNVTALQPSALFMNGPQLQALRDCINVTQTLRARMLQYNDQLVYSIGRMARIAADIQGLGDSFCTCEIAGFTTASTTESTTQSTSTSTSTTSTTPLVTTTTIETTSTIEEVTTTDAGPTLSPCGTFVPYDTIMGVMAPTVDGFSAGTTLDGRELYIGIGTNMECFQAPSPGYIDVESDQPGIYMSCTFGEAYDPMSAEYLQTNPQLTWVMTNTSDMMNVPGGIFIPGSDGFSNFYIGRYIDDNGELHVGKVLYTIFSSSFNYWDEEEQMELTLIDGFEILACQP